MRIIALLVVLCAAAAIIWLQVIPRLRGPEQRAALEARLTAIGAGLWTRITSRLATWRTVILGFFGTAWMMLPDLVQQLQAAPWASWVDEFWSRVIGATLYLAMIVTKINSPGPVGTAPIMPPDAPGNDVLVSEAKKVAIVEEAKAEGKL